MAIWATCGGYATAMSCVCYTDVAPESHRVVRLSRSYYETETVYVSKVSDDWQLADSGMAIPSRGLLVVVTTLVENIALLPARYEQLNTPPAPVERVEKPLSTYG